VACYELTRGVVSNGPSYEVRSSGEPWVLYTVRGTSFSLAPRFTAHEGACGPEVATMRANFTKTKFTIVGRHAATLAFPLSRTKSNMSLGIDDCEYTTEPGSFRCFGPYKRLAFAIEKHRNRLDVEILASLPPLVVLLAAVAIDQKYFQDEAVPASA